jgi:hypothetical protein
MAYWDFNYFINNFLSKEDFYQTLKECGKNGNKSLIVIEDEILHNFTY